MNKFNAKSSSYVILSLIIAAFLWYLMFVIKPMNFWFEMSLSILILIAMALLTRDNLLHLGKIKLRHIIIGITSAVVLYFVFYVGNIITGYIFPFKDGQVLSVYSNRAQGNSLLIGVLLLFIIGPGEEIFWRGFIQNTLSQKLGENYGYILSVLLYSGVHVVTGNFMLIIATFVCGVFWGWIYKKEKSLYPVIISHAIWDVAIFIIFPLM